MDRTPVTKRKELDSLSSIKQAPNEILRKQMPVEAHKMSRALDTLELLAVKRCQITLPYESASKLTEKAICELINIQCEGIMLSNWEANALINLCRQNRCLDTGLSLVYEYAGLKDELVCELLKYNKRLLALKNIENYSLSNNSQSNCSFKDDFVKFLQCVSNIFKSLCCIRVQQRSPLPILTVNDETLFISKLRNDVGDIYKLIEMCYPLPIDQMLLYHPLLQSIHPNYVVLFASLCSSTSTGITESIIMQQYVAKVLVEMNIHVNSMDGNSISPSKKVNETSTNDNINKLGKQCASIYNNIKRMIHLEEKVNVTFRLVTTITTKLTNNNPYDVYCPMLKLPYKNLPVSPITKELVWFENCTDDYKSICKVISTVMADNSLELQLPARIMPQQLAKNDMYNNVSDVTRQFRSRSEIVRQSSGVISSPTLNESIASVIPTSSPKRRSISDPYDGIPGKQKALQQMLFPMKPSQLSSRLIRPTSGDDESNAAADYYFEDDDFIGEDNTRDNEYVHNVNSVSIQPFSNLIQTTAPTVEVDNAPVMRSVTAPAISTSYKTSNSIEISAPLAYSLPGSVYKPRSQSMDEVVMRNNSKI